MIKMRIHTILPEEFPEPWASGWGEDEFGLWMSFTYKGIEQVFRWCEPGDFLMGSPEGEPERESNGADETQHLVKLSKGFWIADSTVTQALWQAVMGEETSYFKGDNLPVEKVNWVGAQSFISKMNGLKPALKLCLPSEAEWEYACRAETTTSFYFGEQITPEWVNYNGQFPYNRGRKGESREQTVDVKSLPPNDWGLYEMHGNVREWCQDWYEKYPVSSLSESVAVIDPKGPETGDYRVLRGGSWASFGGSCRSAFRYHDVPSSRSLNVGFRLARGH